MLGMRRKNIDWDAPIFPMTPPCRKSNGEPSGYVQWHIWAAKKGKTHTQRQCLRCGLYHIWKKKEKSNA